MFIFLAAIAASPSSSTGRNEAARGAAQGKPNLIGVLEATVPSPRDRPQRQANFRARSTKVRTASQAARRDHPPQRPGLPPQQHKPTATRRRRGWTPGTSPATLEPVTVPAGARAAHPPPDTPARDRLHSPTAPRFAGTSRRKAPGLT